MGFGGQLVQSVDGGATWRQQTSPVGDSLKSVAYDSAGRLWLVSDRQVLVSDNAGESWTRIPGEDAVFIHQVIPLRNSIWAVGQFGVFEYKDGATLTALTTLPKDRGQSDAIDN